MISFISKGLFKNISCINSDIIANKKITPDIILATLKVKSLFILLTIISPDHIKNQHEDILGIIPNINLIISISFNVTSRNKIVRDQESIPIIPNTGM